MGVNFDCNLYWTADRRSLLGALSILPEYLRSAAAESGQVIDYRDWQIPLGRRFRALKLWFVLRLEGAEAIADMVRRHVDITQRLVERIVADDRFEILAPTTLNTAPSTPTTLNTAPSTPTTLNMVCVALRAGDAATDELIERVNGSGRALFTRTVLDGRSALRFCVGSRATTAEHVDGAWRLLGELAPAPA
jgi:aromatic-L-amino-acid decarboxylase